MFKIAKLEKVDNEQININLIKLEKNKHENNKKITSETFKTLSFDISGGDYSFSFLLKCRLEKLLEIPMSKTMDFKDYIFYGETWLNIKNQKGFLDPKMDITINRYLKNKFIISLTFCTDDYDDNYSGMIEFTFNLDDYLNIDDK